MINFLVCFQISGVDNKTGGKVIVKKLIFLKIRKEFFHDLNSRNMKGNYQRPETKIVMNFDPYRNKYSFIVKFNSEVLCI